MSPTQSSSGPSALKSRSTRSGAGVASLSRRVVTSLRRPCLPAMASSPIRRATRFSFTFQPCLTRAALTRGEP